MTLHIEFPCSHMLPLPARTSRPSRREGDAFS
jgi:hypothetical protein